MNIEKLSQSQKKLDFIKRFSRVGEDFKHHSKRHRPASQYYEYLLNLFYSTPKELIIINDGKNDIARVCVNQTEYSKEAAFFGFLDYLNFDTLKLLMQEVENYCRVNHLKILYGPIDINVWFSNRLKIQGFNHNHHWEPNSPEFFLTDLLKLNYLLDQQYLSSFYSSIETAYNRTLLGYQKCVEQGLHFRNLDLNREKEVDLLYHLNTISFSQNYLYQPITKDEYIQSHIHFLKNTNFQYSYFIMDNDNRELGYVYSFIDEDRLIIKSLLVDPAARGARISSALAHASIKQAKKNGISLICGACVRKGNVSQHLFDHLGTPERVHEYALLKKNL